MDVLWMSYGAAVGHLQRIGQARCGQTGRLVNEGRTETRVACFFDAVGIAAQEGTLHLTNKAEHQ